MKDRSHGKRKLMKAACLAAGLCAASWSGKAEAATVQDNYLIDVNVSPNQTLNNVNAVFFYTLNGSGGNHSFSSQQRIADSISTGSNNYRLSFYDENSLSHYAVVGVYDKSGTKGVTVGMNEDEAGLVINKLDWNGTFGGISEQNIVNYLTGTSGDDSDYFSLINSLASGKFGTLGSSITLVNFSLATDGGTASANVVPIPSTLLLFGSGLGIMIYRRRK